MLQVFYMPSCAYMMKQLLLSPHLTSEKTGAQMSSRKCSNPFSSDPKSLLFLPPPFSQEHGQRSLTSWTSHYSHDSSLTHFQMISRYLTQRKKKNDMQIPSHALGFLWPVTNLSLTVPGRHLIQPAKYINHFYKSRRNTSLHSQMTQQQSQYGLHD